MKTTITITRQMGSGGSFLGQLIAQRLNIRYIDREVLQLAAEEFGVELSIIEARAERLSTFWEKTLRGFTFGAAESPYTPPPLPLITDQELFNKQTEIMKVLAKENDCVIVGWGAPYVLPRHSRMWTFFCHAPLNFRVQRVMQIYKISNEQIARNMIAESDDMRKKYISHLTGKDWACAENYDLSINTNLLPLEKMSELIVEIIKQKKV